MLAEVRSRLVSGEPLDLLAEVSSLVAALDPRSRSPFERADDSAGRPPGLGELLRTFAEVDRIETSALLAGIAELAPDEALRARAARSLAERHQILPEWLRRLGEAEAYRCVEMVHALGDGDDLIVGARLVGGAELSIVVYVDHNLGTVAKDAFVVPGPIEELVTLMQEDADAPLDTEWRELGLAESRARITEAVEHGSLMFPPFESETWPACRPLVEWVARLLPSGGSGYERPEWDDAAKAALTESFFASDHGMGLDDRDYRDLFESLLWFATDYGPGDPLRWSPVAVEIVLSDWIPRKIVASPAYLSKVPELLRAFVGYAHAERGIRPELTRETLLAVDVWEPDYQRTIRTPRPQGPAALMAAMGVLEADSAWETSGDLVAPPYDIAEIILESLLRAVGSEEALADLTDGVLPDEAFEWDDIPDGIQEKVREVLELCDRCCDELLDVEYRTACRRYLAKVATGGPEVFRRRGRSDTAAAAICWTIGKANNLFAASRGGMTAKQLLEHFGLAQGSVSQRAATLMKATGIGSELGYPAWDVALGTPDLLVASRRHRIIELRDRYAESG